jgi:hypothetical protein
MVTCKSFIEVKSEAPSRPGECSCAKNTSWGAPCKAFHCRTRRSKVRRRESGYFPGCVRCSQSQRVLACKRGSLSNCSATAGQTSASASGQVLQVRGLRASLGSWPSLRYLRADLRSMFALIAAVRSDAP